MNADSYTVILFYKYVHIDNPEEVKVWQEDICRRFGLTGRCIVAREGINATYEGTAGSIQEYIQELEKDERFRNIHFKKSSGTGNAFPKLSIKVRKEIVSLSLGVCDIDPNQMTGKRLRPEELHDWLAPSKVEGIRNKKEFYIVDMRNAYEHKVGHFENSILPPMENFRDLPKVIGEIAHLKDKTVLTICTGGVRCEKASGFLISQGFTDVYQLDGGIVSYMEKYPNEDFKGKLYVFDGRVTMGPSHISRAGFYTDDPKFTRTDVNPGGQEEIVGKCDSCGESTEHYVNCANPACHRHFLACEKCEKGNAGSILCPGGCVLNRHGRKVSRAMVNLV